MPPLAGEQDPVGDPGAHADLVDLPTQMTGLGHADGADATHLAEYDEALVGAESQEVVIRRPAPPAIAKCRQRRAGTTWSRCMARTVPAMRCTPSAWTHAGRGQMGA